MPYIRLQKINSTHIKYIVSEMSYEVTVKKDNGICSLQITNKEFIDFQGNLFFYNNHYLFSALTSFLYIKKNKKYI